MRCVVPTYMKQLSTSGFLPAGRYFDGCLWPSIADLKTELNGWQAGTQTDAQRGRHVNRQTSRQTRQQTDRQAGRQTERKTEH